MAFMLYHTTTMQPQRQVESNSPKNFDKRQYC